MDNYRPLHADATSSEASGSGSLFGDSHAAGLGADPGRRPSGDRVGAKDGSDSSRGHPGCHDSGAASQTRMSLTKDKVETQESRRRLGLPATPFADRVGGSLAAQGLGNGRGTFNLQRQMLDEQRRATAALRDLKTLPQRIAAEL